MVSLGVPGPDAGFKLLGGGAPGYAHEAAVLQGQPGPALHWLIARAHTGIVVGGKVGEGGGTPTSHHLHPLLRSGLFAVCCKAHCMRHSAVGSVPP